MKDAIWLLSSCGNNKMVYNRRAHGHGAPLGSGGAQACQHLRFSPGRPVCRLLTSRTIIYVILSYLFIVICYSSNRNLMQIFSVKN